MNEKTKNIIVKIILLVLIINVFNFIWDNFLINQKYILANSLQKIFFWPLNQIPQKTPTLTNDFEPASSFSNIFVLPEVSKNNIPYESKVDYEQRIINAVKSTDKSVVSVVAFKDLPVSIRQQINPLDLFGDDFFKPLDLYFQTPQQPNTTSRTEKREIASGSGFIITSDGYIVTNKHVISEKDAEFIVFLNDGSQHNAKVVAVDPFEDFGLLKIEKQSLTPLKIGHSDSLQLGQSVIAIGNALGEFKNTISVGVISGLNRSIVAGGANMPSERLNNLIQTDAAINRGNSGGPLLNLNGEVIGINTATVTSAQNIGFAIPINKIKNTLSQAIKTGKITVPYIGIYYVQLDQNEIAKRELSVTHGALLSSNASHSAILKDSPAEKYGLLDNDIILSVNGEKITSENPLPDIIRKHQPGETVILEVKRDEKTINISLTLGEK